MRLLACWNFALKKSVRLFGAFWKKKIEHFGKLIIFDSVYTVRTSSVL